MIEPGTADQTTDQEPTRLQLEQLLLDLALGNVERVGNLAAVCLLVVLEVDQHLLRGGTADDRLQHDWSPW